MIWETFSSQFLERVCVRVVLFLLHVFNKSSSLQKSTLGLEILFMETITNSVGLIHIGPFRASISSCISFDKFLFQGICSPHVCSWVYWCRASLKFPCFLVSVGSVTISSLLFLILVICEFSSFLSALLGILKDLLRYNGHNKMNKFKVYDWMTVDTPLHL